MLYLLACFFPPLALLLAVKPFHAIINLVLYILAWFGLFFMLVPGILLWVVAVFHAVLVINASRADKRAQKIIKAVKDA